MKVTSGYVETTYAYGSHMGTCDRIPGLAWARVGAHRVELCADVYPLLNACQLQEKAIAIARAQIKPSIPL